nr:hypothetical protein I308_06699 [Cryptococcus tetragattii IND107]
MEIDGESNWDEWIAAFKDAALPLEWAVSEQRSLHRLQFATARDWPAFDTQATLHRCNLMGTDRYPSDAQMALVYCTACPDSLYPRVKMKWAYKLGSLHEIRTLLELEELTSQLADHLNLKTHLDKDHDLYALFHPPLVIQVSVAADGCTSTAPSHPLRFLLDTGAGTSFFDPSVVAKLGWKVCQNAVERTVQLAGGKPGPVARDVTGGSFRV